MKILLHSSQKFLQEFLELQGAPKKKLSESDAHFLYRKTCMAGFMALDCALSVYWKEIVVPEWANLMATCNELLANEVDLNQLLDNMNGSLTRGQMIASMRFLENTGDPDRFSPSLVDCGLVFAILQDKSHRLPFTEAADKLCRMQKYRNCVFHSGKNFSEIEAAASVKCLKEAFALLPKLNPVFRDCFTQIPTEDSLAAFCYLLPLRRKAGMSRSSELWGRRPSSCAIFFACNKLKLSCSPSEGVSS